MEYRCERVSALAFICMQREPAIDAHNTHTTYDECSGAAVLTCKGIPYVVKTGDMQELSTVLLLLSHYRYAPASARRPEVSNRLLCLMVSMAKHPA